MAAHSGTDGPANPFPHSSAVQPVRRLIQSGETGGSVVRRLPFRRFHRYFSSSSLLGRSLRQHFFNGQQGCPIYRTLSYFESVSKRLRPLFCQTVTKKVGDRQFRIGKGRHSSVPAFLHSVSSLPVASTSPLHRYHPWVRLGDDDREFGAQPGPYSRWDLMNHSDLSSARE
jgi:hypothetical protein